MVDTGGSVEMIIGSKKDPTFGAVIMVGLGGVAAEVFRDFRLGLPPLSETLARRMLESLRCWPLLQGHRGRPAVDVDRLIEVLIRFSYLVADQPRIQELDINPMLVTPGEVIALDGRVIVDPSVDDEALPFSHLAIRPYPEQYVKKVVDEKGNTVTLRPIKPEDEPMWHELLASCSPESIKFRFRYLFKATTHEMASRFCFLDYDREIAIVAEIEEEDRRRLIGVGRLVADADHRNAEYAILIGDAWQGVGLGAMLTDYCLEVCSRWGIARVVAETAPDNHRMIELFDHRQFEIDRTSSADTVRVSKTITLQPTS
jgi:acetyltransferase